jgi:hypothetical protein
MQRIDRGRSDRIRGRQQGTHGARVGRGIAQQALIAAGLLTAALFVLPGVRSVAEEDPMAAMMKYAQPGAHHAHMAELVGTWNVKATMWMEPGAPPMESGGTAEVREALGGRYFETTYSSEFMGMPFEGRGFDGYDNRTGEHFATWADNMSTFMMTFRGKCAEGGNVVTLVGEFVDPATGMAMSMKTVSRAEGDDRVVFEGYTRPADGGGDYFKNMELVYTRQ